MRHWLARRRAAEQQEIDEEIEAHLASRIEYFIERGMAADEARAEAMRRFGDLESARRSLYRAGLHHGPKLRLSDRLHDLWLDTRYVARGLSRTPAFTLGVIATLTLGLGVNAAVFRVADVVLFRAPAGVVAPENVRRLELALTFGRGQPTRSTTFSYPDAALALTSGAFERASAYVVQAGRDDAGRDLTVNFIDAGFFQVLGVHPAAGRDFTADEGTPGNRLPAAIVSRDYWRRALAAASLDTAPPLTINGRTYPVVGVMPEGFRGIDLDPTDVWLPLGVGEFGRGEINGVVIPWYQTGMMRAVRFIGRRPAGDVTDAALAAKIDAAFKSGSNLGERQAALLPIVPVGGGGNKDTNILLGRLTFVAAIILVIACANAINLLLARAVSRRQEIAIRMAIGASRGRVSRLLLIESALLASLGGTAALIGGFWTSEGLRRLLFPDAKWTAATFDQRTLVFTGALALIAGLVAGLAPAMQSTSPDLVTGLKHQRLRGGGRTRFTRTALIVTQTALSLTLLVASGLLVRSLIRLNAVPLGFDPDGLVTVTLSTPRTGQPPAGQIDGDALAARLTGTGRVQTVALASNVPFGAMAVMTTKVIGATREPADDDQARWTAVSPNYFSVMRTRTIEGRTFTDRDVVGSDPVIVINESMARAYFGGTPPSNACIMPVGAPCMHIIGIVEDVRDTPNGAAPPMRYYMPLAQYRSPINGVIVRTKTEDARDVAAIARAMFPATQRVPIDIVRDRVDTAMRPWHSATWLFSALGALALVLACVGMYSVMTYVASERIHEMGVRVMLGATAGDIVRLVGGHGLLMTAGGAMIGVAAAAIGGRFLGTLLFGVSPFDPMTYLLALAGLVAASLLAVLPPALRASRVDPLAAFRAE